MTIEDSIIGDIIDRQTTTHMYNLMILESTIVIIRREEQRGRVKRERLLRQYNVTVGKGNRF